MSIFQEYDNELVRNYDILFRQFEIDISKLENSLMMESSMEEMEEIIFAESDDTIDLSYLFNDNQPKEKKRSKFMEMMQSISEAISKFITDIIDMITNMFSGSSHIDTETYLSSNTGKIELENDVRMVNKKAKDKVREGRKLIQAISNKANVDPSVINDYVDAVAKGIQENGKVVLQTASAYSQLKHANDDLVHLKNEMKDALKDCKDVLGDPTKEMQVKRVYTAMQRCIKEATYAHKLLCRNLYNEALRKQEEEKKNKKNTGGR